LASENFHFFCLREHLVDGGEDVGDIELRLLCAPHARDVGKVKGRRCGCARRHLDPHVHSLPRFAWGDAQGALGGGDPVEQHFPRALKGAEGDKVVAVQNAQGELAAQDGAAAGARVREQRKVDWLHRRLGLTRTLSKVSTLLYSTRL